MDRTLDINGFLSERLEDQTILDALGQAMYHVRAPQKSLEEPYAIIRSGKKKMNQELALALITSMNNLSGVNPDKLVEIAAMRLYEILAPQKSRAQPWETRSEFHHAWYRTQVMKFIEMLRAILMFRDNEVIDISLIPVQTVDLQYVTRQKPSIHKLLTVDESIVRISTPSELEVMRLTTGESLDDLGDETPEVGRDTDRSLPDPPPMQSPEANVKIRSLEAPLYLIAVLLLILILVVVIF